MSNDFDLNSVTAAVIDSQIEDFIDLLKSAGLHWTQKLRLSWEAAFKGYVTQIANRHSRARSFFHRAEPEYLYNFYVPIGVKTKNRSIPRVDAKSLFSPTPHAVIQGSGGCGKSVLTRHLLLDILRIKARIPVLVELRSLNQEWKPILTIVGECLKECGLELSDAVIARGVEKGNFSLLFDGFDELNDEIRSRTAKEIRKLSTIGKDTWILVTSRPDEMFAGWSEFSLYTALPLTVDQAVSLVNQTPIEEDLRKRFVKDLKSELFDRHKSFLSNPLLLSIMLLTYQDAADIPKKISVFYSQAYEALFQRHDAWKGGYKRSRKCDLDIHDFGRLFAAFSLVAYDKRLFSFPNSDALHLIKKACSLANLEVPHENFLSDCIQAVCLLVQDGWEIAYTHRSFQEYFTARFIADAPPSLKSQLLDRYSKNLRLDSVVRLLYEIQPEFVESSLILPELEQVFSELNIKGGKISRPIYCRFLKTYFDSIRIDKELDVFATPKKNRTKSLNILRLAIQECIHLTRHQPIRVHDVRSKQFRIEMCAKEASIEVQVKDITQNHPIIDHLFEDGGYLGPEVLSICWAVAAAIRQKIVNSDRPLDEILETESVLSGKARRRRPTGDI